VVSDNLASDTLLEFSHAGLSFLEKRESGTVFCHVYLLGWCYGLGFG